MAKGRPRPAGCRCVIGSMTCEACLKDPGPLIYDPPKPTHPCVVHVNSGLHDAFIGRPSVWGNPFKIGQDGTRAEVIEKYRAWIQTRPDLIARAKRELRGKVLGCFCAPEACHGDVLLKIANEE